MLSLGTKFGAYEILTPLLGGGMGLVYRARDTRLGRMVAIKILPEAAMRDQERVLRFEQEARAASALNHPNILTVYEFGQCDGIHYLASEFVEGSTLQELIATSMPLNKVLDIAIQAASGLAAAHAAGIVHRDIKPANLVVRPDGYVKILDFGLAKLTEANQLSVAATPGASTIDTGPLTEAGKILGTWLYMSPEQVRGLELDARTDIWSLGTMIYEMVTGHSPFSAPTVSDTISSILTRQPEPLTQVTASMPKQRQELFIVAPELQHVIDRALAKDREDRYQSAKDLGLDLKEIRKQIESPISDRRLSALTSAATATLTPARRITRREMLLLTGGGAVALASAGWFARNHFAAPAAHARMLSLAVLPLSNDSGDHEQDYFADGMTEILITYLARMSGLKRVISRNSVMQYRQPTRPLRDIAHDLGVDGLVTGAVLRSGQSVRITAHLIDPVSDRHLWDEVYDGDVSDVLALQSRVALHIAESIHLRLSQELETALAQSKPVNPSAQEAYLRGRFYWNKREPDDVRKALEYFEQAVQESPEYALGYVGIADSYVVLIDFGAADQQQLLGNARKAAIKALQLEPELAEAHASLAFINFADHFQLRESEKQFQNALRLNPNYATAAHWYAYLLAGEGRLDEALRTEKRALELDPFSPPINTYLACIHYLRREFQEAIQASRQALEMFPKYWPARLILALSYNFSGQVAQGIKEAEAARKTSAESPDALAFLGHIYAAAGEKRKALQALHDLRTLADKTYVSPADYAILYAAMDHDAAFQWLEKADQNGALWTIFLKTDPIFDKLRGDDRYALLLRNSGLAS